MVSMTMSEAMPTIAARPLSCSVFALKTERASAGHTNAPFTYGASISLFPLALPTGKPTFPNKIKKAVVHNFFWQAEFPAP